MRPLKTGYPHLDSYGNARKTVAYASVLYGYCRQLRNVRKKTMGATSSNTSSLTHHANVDAAARDAVRCIEHAMVVVSGEKSVYRCVVSPASSHSHDESKVLEPHYQKALVASYSYVASAAVDRLLDLIEYTFLREAGCVGNAPGGGQGGAGGTGESEMDIRAAASAAAKD